MTTETTQTTTKKPGRRSTGFRRLLVLGIVGTLLLTACGTAESDNESVTETTTTLSGATDPTTPATTGSATTVPAASVVLGSQGLGIVRLGAEPEEAIAAVSAHAGAPTFDTGWIDAAATTCPGTEFREVAWDGLVLRFNDAADATAPDGGRHFFSYWYSGDTGLATVEGIGLGATVADLETTYGAALSTENSPAIGSTWQVDGDPFFGGGLTGIAAGDVVTSIEGGIRCAE